METALVVVALLDLPAVIVWIGCRPVASEGAVERWARTNRFEILHQSISLRSRVLFTTTCGYRVTVRDRRGKVRDGTLCVGPDGVDVRWET